MVCIAETLEVHDFPRPQKPDCVVDIRVVGKPQNIVIGDAGFLFGGQVLGEVGNHVALDLHGGGGPWEAGRGGRIYPGGMVDEIRVKSGLFGLLLRQIPRQLMDNRPHHFQMSQFVCASAL